MKISQILLAALFITSTSCNDGVKINPPQNQEQDTNTLENEIKTEIKKDESESESESESITEEVSDCLKNLRQECVTGKWTLQSVKLNEKGMPKKELKLTESQKNQYIEVVGNKVSGRIFVVNEEDTSLRYEDDPTLFKNIDYSLYEDEGDKKMRFQIDQNKIDSIIKNLKNNTLILTRSGKTKFKEYDIETVWTKKA